MQTHNIQLDSSIDISSINLAIGNFDGIHIGHQEIMQRLINQSKNLKMDSAILSFEPHPRQFFSKKYDNYNIINNDLKIKLLESFGIDHFFLLKFDQLTASLKPEEFIDRILINMLKVKNLVVGYDFKFGKNRIGNIKLLQHQSYQKYFSVNILDPIKSKKTSEIISSSLIRKNIQNGNFEKVTSYIGRNWSMSGTVIQGDKRAGKMNFPTANIMPPNLINPKKGVYAVKVQYDNKLIDGIANFGIRPTVDANKLLLEVHLFDFSADIYGKNLTVEFLTFIRDEKKFNNFKQLTEQIYKDIEVAKNFHLNNKHAI